MPRRVRSSFASLKMRRPAASIACTRRAREVVAVRRAASPGDHLLVDDVDRELARDLAGGGAAHAVADGEDGAAFADDLVAVGLHQPRLALREVGDEEVVLVVLAHLADVGAAEEAQLDRRWLAPCPSAVRLAARTVRWSRRNGCCLRQHLAGRLVRSWAMRGPPGRGAVRCARNRRWRASCPRGSRRRCRSTSRDR